MTTSQNGNNRSSWNRRYDWETILAPRVKPLILIEGLDFEEGKMTSFRQAARQAAGRKGIKIKTERYKERGVQLWVLENAL